MHFDFEALNFRLVLARPCGHHEPAWFGELQGLPVCIRCILLCPPVSSCVMNLSSLCGRTPLSKAREAAEPSCSIGRPVPWVAPWRGVAGACCTFRSHPLLSIPPAFPKEQASFRHSFRIGDVHRPSHPKSRKAAVCQPRAEVPGVTGALALSLLGSSQGG